MLSLKGDEEVKLEPEDPIAENIKLNLRKTKNTSAGFIQFMQIEKQNQANTVYLLYLHSKITKKVYNKLIKSL